MLSLAAKSKAENLADLKSADDAVAIKAAQELGADGAKDAIEPLGEILKSKRTAGVRIAAASALGRMDVKGRPTTLLREAIEAGLGATILPAAFFGISSTTKTAFGTL